MSSIACIEWSSLPQWNVIPTYRPNSNLYLGPSNDHLDLARIITLIGIARSTIARGSTVESRDPMMIVVMVGCLANIGQRKLSAYKIQRVNNFMLRYVRFDINLNGLIYDAWYNNTFGPASCRSPFNINILSTTSARVECCRRRLTAQVCVSRYISDGCQQLGGVLHASGESSWLVHHDVTMTVVSIQIAHLCNAV